MKENRRKLWSAPAERVFERRRRFRATQPVRQHRQTRFPSLSLPPARLLTSSSKKRPPRNHPPHPEVSHPRKRCRRSFLPLPPHSKKDRPSPVPLPPLPRSRACPSRRNSCYRRSEVSNRPNEGNSSRATHSRTRSQLELRRCRGGACSCGHLEGSRTARATASSPEFSCRFPIMP